MSLIGVAILAAGKGTRLKIDTPKPLLSALGQTLVQYVVDEILEFSKLAQIKTSITAVVGHKKEDVKEHLQGMYPEMKFAWQQEQKGTADALKSYFSETPENWNFDWTFITCADTPLISAKIYSEMWNTIQGNPQLDAVAATFEAKNPTGYGRIIRSPKGFRIVEEKEASLEEKKNKEVNSGFYLVRTKYLKEFLGQVTNKNSSGEFYLTDIFKPDQNVLALNFQDETPFIGVNTLSQLAQITEILRAKKVEALTNFGVTFFDTKSAYIDWSVAVNSGTIIYPNVTILGTTKIGQSVLIESNSFIKNSILGDKVQILASSYVEGAVVKHDAHIGPFARLRPQAEIGEFSKIGNFVEVKKSKLAANVKVSHLSYVGDATIGENTNIGCGFVTCNYDGANKHQSIIGSNTFIGSDCQVVAPISIGDSAFIAAGSTVTKDVPSHAFAISRSSQVTKEGMAHKFLKKKAH